MNTKIYMSTKKKFVGGMRSGSKKTLPLGRLLCSGFILALAGLGFAPQTHGMRLHHSFKQIVRDADLIFVGTVVRQDAQWDTGKKMIFTHVHFAVNEIIYDRTENLVSEGRELILPFAGGQIDDRAMSVSDVPIFRENESYVIFARIDGKQYASPTVGGYQGVFGVMDDEVTDQRYPLTAGGHAILKVSQGELIKKSAVSRIRSGIMENRDNRWLERRQGLAPQPAMNMGAARAEVASSDAEIPAKIMTLADFIDEIRNQIDAADKEVAP